MRSFLTLPNGTKIKLRRYLEIDGERVTYQLCIPTKDELPPDIKNGKFSKKTGFRLNNEIEGSIVLMKNIKNGGKVNVDDIDELRTNELGLLEYQEIIKFKYNPTISRYVNFE